MPIYTTTSRALDIVRIQANAFKILGFEVHTDTEEATDDRVFVRKEARHIVNGVQVSQTPMRGTEYTAVTMLPVLADIAKRLASALNVSLPAVPDDALGYALYVAFRDGLYEAERLGGEFPSDAS